MSLCKAVSLKLHLQKHYLLKNFSSKDIEITLDENETFVDVRPAHGGGGGGGGGGERVSRAIVDRRVARCAKSVRRR